MVIIGLVVVLAAVIGYTLYLQQGPLKSTSEKYKILENEIAQLKSASQTLKATHNSEIEANTKLLESLQKEKAQLEGTISRIRQERETEEAELQKKFESLERRLAQSEQELVASRNITQQLDSALEKIKADHESELADKIRLVEELKRKSSQLGETLIRNRKETESLETDLQGTVTILQNQLVQRERELEIARSETQQVKAASEVIEADYQAKLAEKVRLVEELQKRGGELEETLSRVKKETETLEADLRGTVKNLENQLAQWDRDLQTSRQEVQKLRNAITLLESGKETLRRQSEDLNRRLLASGNQIQGLQKELSDQKAQLAKAMEAHQILAEQFNLQQEEGVQLKQNKTDLENQLAETEKNRQSLLRQLNLMQEESVQLKQSKMGLENQLAETEKNRQSLLGQIDIQKKEKAELERLKNALKNQLGMTQSQITELSSDAAAKEEKLKTKEKQLTSMERAYQELHKQFEKQINEKEILISTLEDKLNIRLLDKILFASGSSEITSDGNRVLTSLAGELKKMQGFEISVVGHTDNKLLMPKLKQIYYDNLGLSVARAASVSRALRSMGVNPENLSATGYSMYRPVTGNDTVEGRQENRRVEIILTPLR